MTYKVKHFPKFDTQAIERLYSKKDGVPVEYVCTTELRSYGRPLDIYYRETPHPEFGNSYFGLGYYHYANPPFETYIGISNADEVEELTFACIPNSEEVYTYSQHTHDYREWGSASIDGGRSYTRLLYDRQPPEVKTFVVRDGEFINVQ